VFVQRTALAQSQIEASAQVQSQSGSRNQDSALVIERGLYVDSTRSLGIEDVTHQVFTPFKLLLNLSLSPTTRWLKIKVQAPTRQQSPLVLVIGPYFLSELELYYEDSGRWVNRLSGAKHSEPQLNCSIGHHCFTLPASEAKESVYFLRIDTINGFYTSAQVLASDLLVDHAASTSLTFGIQIGFFLLLIGWSAVYFSRSPRLLAGLFCLTQIAALFFYCFSSGIILREFISASPGSYIQILNIALCVRVAFSCCVCFELSRRWQTHRRFRNYFLLLLTFWFVQIILVIVGYIEPYMLLLNWVFLLTAPIVIAFAVLQAKQLTRAVKIYWVAGVLTVIVLVLVDLILSTLDPGLSIMILTPISGASLMAAYGVYLLLVGYSKAQQEQWLQTMFEFNSLKAQNDYEQQQLKERSTLIDMLSHELKNPLATMRIALGSLKSIFGKPEYQVEFNERFSSITQSIDNMTQVIDRVGQVDAVDQKNFVVHFEVCGVFEAIENLPLVAKYPNRFKFNGKQQLNIRTDKLLFSTIINNLIDNAIKYSPPESMIEVSVSSVEADKFLCTVSNEVERDHAPDPTALFTRYYRSAYSHDKPGTGLGLVLIKSLCERLKGSVSYRFDYNRVFFSIELPL
jgi:signal transduction histidine kinase